MTRLLCWESLMVLTWGLVLGLRIAMRDKLQEKDHMQYQHS